MIVAVMLTVIVTLAISIIVICGLIISISKEQIDAIRVKAYTENAFVYMAGIVGRVMHDEFNWEEDECEWLEDKLLAMCNCTEDVAELLSEEELI